MEQRKTTSGREAVVEKKCRHLRRQMGRFKTIIYLFQNTSYEIIISKSILSLDFHEFFVRSMSYIFKRSFDFCINPHIRRSFTALVTATHHSYVKTIKLFGRLSNKKTLFCTSNYLQH